MAFSIIKLAVQCAISMCLCAAATTAAAAAAAAAAAD
jgi:hypothetical protein